MWQTLKPLLNRDGWQAMRVENPIGPGTPDINWLAPPMEGWVEMKFVKRYPPRGGVVQMKDFTPQQRVWLAKRCRVGGRAHLIVHCDEEWLLFHGMIAAMQVGKIIRPALYDAAQRVWRGAPPRDELRAELTK